MIYNKVKKYKSVINDKLHYVKFTIYSNEKLTKQKKLYYIRQYLIKCNKLPPLGSFINIIADN